MEDLYLSYTEDEENPWLAEVKLSDGTVFAGYGISAIAAVVNCATAMKRFMDEGLVDG